MARSLNFDAIVVETIDVTKAGHTSHLRDDVPMTVLVRTFALMEHQQAIKSRADITSAEAEVWLAELQAMTLALCGDIWRHSLPETTDDELAALFSFEEQMQLVMLFFTTRSLALQRQASALGASSLPTTSQPETGAAETAAGTPASSATGNRQQRRGAAAGTSRRKK